MPPLLRLWLPGAVDRGLLLQTGFHHRRHRHHQAHPARDLDRHHHPDLLLRGVPEAEDRPQGCAESRRDGRAVRTGPDPPSAAGQEGRRLPALHSCDLLLRLDHEYLRGHPLIEFPATSKFAFPVALAFIVWVTYITIGIKSKGPIGYFKRMAVPEGAPWWILPLLSPVELFSNILV